MLDWLKELRGSGLPKKVNQAEFVHTLNSSAGPKANVIREKCYDNFETYPKGLLLFHAARTWLRSIS